MRVVNRRRRINHRRLEHFHEVLTRGSISSAANIMGTLPSVVSRQIQLLEKEFDLPFFVRKARLGMEPNEAARALEEYYQGCLALQDILDTRLDKLRDMQGGVISLAIPGTFVRGLTNVFNEFHRKCPGVSLHIEEKFESTKIIQQILEDVSHIGIAHICPEHPDIRHHARVPLPLYLLVSKKHPLAGKCKVTLAEAVRYPLSLPVPDVLLQAIESIACSEKIELPVTVFMSNSTTARKQFACTGAGAVFMSLFSAREEIERGELVALEVDHSVFKEAELVVIVRRGRTLLPAVNTLLGLLSSHLSIFMQKPNNPQSIALGASYG